MNQVQSCLTIAFVVVAYMVAVSSQPTPGGLIALCLLFLAWIASFRFSRVSSSQPPPRYAEEEEEEAQR